MESFQPDLDRVYGWWSYDNLRPREYARLSLLYKNRENGYFSGVFMGGDGYEAEVNGGPLYVSPNLRGRGLATRLVETLAYTALQEGVGVIVCSVASQHTLAIFKKLARQEHFITFYDNDPADEYVELPMDSQQAYNSLVRAEQSELDLEERRISFDTVIDLRLARRNLDNSSLEQPVIQNKPRHTAKGLE
jgi:GNAT superfamily N-acetyltransferase